MVMSKDFKDQARGMLVGLAVGDTIGAPVQFDYDSETIRKNLDTLRNYHFNHVLPKGVWTDDTSMALCIADSLLERGGYDSYDIMERYCSWENLGYRSYYNFGYDVGAQVDRAICAYADNPVIPKGQERVWNAGNGNIMRLAPIIIAAYHQNAKDSQDDQSDESDEGQAESPDQTDHISDNFKHTVELAWLSGRETHYSEVAECGSEVFANLLYRALEFSGASESAELDSSSDDTSSPDPTSSTADPKSAIVKLDNLYFTSEELHECWLDNSWYVENRIHSDGECLRDLGGYVMDAITIAIWSFLRNDDFESGMFEVLQLGGDTDTNCAIYGQLAGAYYGFSSIPERWLKDLYLGDEIIDLADRLAAMPACPILTTRFEEDEKYFTPPPDQA